MQILYFNSDLYIPLYTQYSMQLTAEGNIQNLKDHITCYKYTISWKQYLFHAVTYYR